MLTVRNKLHVSDLQNHVEGEALRRLLEDLNCLQLLLGVAGDETGVDVSPNGLHKVWVVVRKDFALMEVKDLVA